MGFRGKLFPNRQGGVIRISLSKFFAFLLTLHSRATLGVQSMNVHVYVSETRRNNLPIRQTKTYACVVCLALVIIYIIYIILFYNR